MRIMGLALTGTTLALAGILAVGVADTAHHKFGAHRFDHFPQVDLNDGGWDGGLIRMRAGGQKAASVRQ